MSRGYFGIGIMHHKSNENIGTLWRHAWLHDASFIFTIGKNKYKKSATDTTDASKHVPLYHHDTFDKFYQDLPSGVRLVGIEYREGYTFPELHTFTHPERAIYLLGSESSGLSLDALRVCDDIISIHTPKPYSMNVATSGTIVMYDRIIKGLKKKVQL